MLQTPFPPSFECPEFNKYMGKGDPCDHFKDFFMACQEVTYNENYLICLFPQNLVGQSLEWFLHIPKGFIFTFVELAKNFVHQLSVNMESDITVLDLCNTKQRNNENFGCFLQIW